MLDRTELCRRFANDEKFEFLFFGGHQVPEGGKITASCLNQWYLAPFEVNGVAYKTAEHWMMASKAKLFGDRAMVHEILAARPEDREVAGAEGSELR